MSDSTFLPSRPVARAFTLSVNVHRRPLRKPGVQLEDFLIDGRPVLAATDYTGELRALRPVPAWVDVDEAAAFLEAWLWHNFSPPPIAVLDGPAPMQHVASAVTVPPPRALSAAEMALRMSPAQAAIMFGVYGRRRR